MYIYIYIHIYMYIYLFIYTYIQTTTNPLQYIYIYLFIYTYIQTTTNPLHTTTQPTRTQPPYPSHAPRAPPGAATRNTRRVFKTPWHSHKKHKARLQKKKNLEPGTNLVTVKRVCSTSCPTTSNAPLPSASSMV